jgi:hypothetical protein
MLSQLVVLAPVGQIGADTEGSATIKQLFNSPPNLFCNVLISPDPILQMPSILKKGPEEVFIFESLSRVTFLLSA